MSFLDPTSGNILYTVCPRIISCGIGCTLQLKNTIVNFLSFTALPVAYLSTIALIAYISSLEIGETIIIICSCSNGRPSFICTAIMTSSIISAPLDIVALPNKLPIR